MVITYSKGKDQQGKVAIPSGGQLKRESVFFFFLVSAVPFRVSPLISILRLNLVFTYGVPPEFRGDVHLYIQTVIRHRVSPEFIRSRNCVPMAFTTESPPAQSQ